MTWAPMASWKTATPVWARADGRKEGGRDFCSGGEGGIRTREKLAPLRDFQSRPFVHSGTSPRRDDTMNYRFGLTPPQVRAGRPGQGSISNQME